MEAILPKSVNGQTVNETSRLLIEVFKECGVKGVTLVLALLEMAYMAWDSPEIIAYSKDKEETAYQFGYMIGSMLLTIVLIFLGKEVADILGDKQLMGNMVGNAKLQFRGFLTQRDCIALAAGSRGGIAIQIGQVYTPAAVVVIEGSATTAAEQGIILKAGKILAAGYPAGKIGADTAEKICEKVGDGETDAEEIAEDVEEEAKKSDINNLDIDKMFTEDAIGHLDEVKGFDKDKGVKGAHTPESFKEFVEGPRHVEILSEDKIYDGIYEIKYKVGKIDRADNPILKPDGSYSFLLLTT